MTQNYKIGNTIYKNKVSNRYAKTCTISLNSLRLETHVYTTYIQFQDHQGQICR